MIPGEPTKSAPEVEALYLCAKVYDLDPAGFDRQVSAGVALLGMVKLFQAASILSLGAACVLAASDAMKEEKNR
jgi:hypothetical protein